jgi:dolichyl-phosphate-mannose--protein O-mannosyl transferase
LGDLGAWAHRSIGDPVSRALRDPIAPVIALCAILVFSFAMRVIDIEQPCNSPCKTPASHTLIFDEAYYVNAARVIDGIHPASGQNYAAAPLGKDPNAEHPQLAKLIIAAGIDIFGDNPWGWRLGSILFGLLALAAIYWLVRGAGGSGWLAAGAAAVASMDNLFLVQSRAGLLDIYAVALMIIAAGFYVRKQRVAAGVALGVGMCMKEVAIYMLAVFLLYEALLMLRAWWNQESIVAWVRTYARPFGILFGCTALSFLVLLWILDIAVPAYDTGTKITYAGSPFTHFFHMVNYATLLTTHPNESGIASTPFQWLLNEKAIPYAKTVADVKTGGKIIATHPIYFFQGAINPFIIFLAIPAVAACLGIWWRTADRLALLAVAWFIGTWVPSVFESYALLRVNYLYYMVIVMPAIYVALARVFADRRVPRVATVSWAILLVFGFADLYPIRHLL